ncbi:hypothetical protein ES703_68473 [subsurface metagenome]
MSKFWDLLERSVIVQSALPVMFGGTCVILWLRSLVVPERLWQLTLMCVLFWMGAKVQHQVDRNRTVKGRGATPGRVQE